MENLVPRGGLFSPRVCWALLALSSAFACSSEKDATKPGLLPGAGSGEAPCEGCSPMTGGRDGSGGGRGSGGSDGTGGSVEPPEEVDCTRTLSTASYAFDANVPASPSPPGGLEIEDTPLFVSLGFDDNSDPAGVDWARTMLSTRGVGSSFFYTSTYTSSAGGAWKQAFDSGLEAGYHTDDHAHGGMHSESIWASQLSTNRSALEGIGIAATSLFGFRAPYLEYNDQLLTALRAGQVWYDCSIEEGFDATSDGSNLNFPYTLDSGSPGHEVVRRMGISTRQFPINSHPGLFELPVYALLVPDDSFAATYSFTPGLRSRVASNVLAPMPGDKITGFDWNLWFDARMSGPEVLAILKYNFDQRRSGNRAPFLFGAHSEYYVGFPDRQKAIEDFLDYVLTFPETRVVSYKEVLDFVREPKPLECF